MTYRLICVADSAVFDFKITYFGKREGEAAHFEPVCGQNVVCLFERGEICRYDKQPVRLYNIGKRPAGAYMTEVRRVERAAEDSYFHEFSAGKLFSGFLPLSFCGRSQAFCR